jgi:precorrin-6B C5,15-methyltransferase / cobalt-precorrin-6B C5,C15-methyltransferase
VFEYLGGPRERRIAASAEEWRDEAVAGLNIIAIDCRAGAAARPRSRQAGLPDDAFRHDGQLTKRPVRAATLSALAPLPGELLWDIGAGSGSIAIEWLRSDRGMSAIAIERVASRAAFIAENAAALGVPEIEIVRAAAPAALVGLPAPDAIFLGGSVGDGAIWDAAWQALKPGGRLVANAVTLQGETELFRRHESLGGELMRMAVARAEDHRFWRPAMPVAQLALVKPR